MRMWAAALLLVMVLSGLARAQQGPTGALAVMVRDETGATVPGATVTITSTATGIEARRGTTAGDGTCFAGLLPAGAYRVVVSAAGFAPWEASNVRVGVARTLSLPISLRVGTFEQRITVSDLPALNSDNAATGQAIVNIDRFPAAGRDYLRLLALAPSTTSELPGTALLGRNNLSIQVNGQRSSSNNYQLEGMNANDYSHAQFAAAPLPNPAAVAELSIQTSLYDAARGRNLGGDIAVTLKSGASKLHGDLFEFFGNERLNANDFFLNRQGSQRPVSRQNQFGGSLGGPAGKIGFFFLNYQGTRQRSGLDKGTELNSLIAFLPIDRSAANLARTFQVPAEAIDPVALALLNMKSDHFGPGLGGGFLIPSVAPIASGRPSGLLVVSSPGQYRDDQFVTSLDRQVANRGKLTARWFFSDNQALLPFFSTSPQALPQSSRVPLRNRFLALGETHVLGPRAVNEWGLGFSRHTIALRPGELISLADIGATRPNAAEFPAAFAVDVGAPGFQIGTGVNDDRGTAANTFILRDTLSKTWGAHALRFGGQASRYQLNEHNNFATRGVVSFRAALAGATAFQNFLLGNVRSTQARTGLSKFYFRNTDYTAFLQDDWKVARRLSLSVGLRWEPMGVGHETRHLLANMTGVNDDDAVRFVFPEKLAGLGTPGVGNCTFKHCRMWPGFAPRVGFAWDPTGSARWAIRGGYGIYHDRFSNEVLMQSALGVFAWPMSSSGVPLNNPFAGLNASSGARPGPQPIPQLLSVADGGLGTPTFSGPLLGFTSFGDRNLQAPYSAQWNFTVQHIVGSHWLVETGWVGGNGVQLLFNNKAYNIAWPATQANPLWQPTPGGWTEITGSTAANVAARVPAKWLGFGAGRLQPITKDGGSTYHSWQSRVTRRFGNSFFQASYTFSKSMDNTSGSLAGLGDDLSGNTEWNGNQRLSRAVSDFDRPHRLVLAFVYEFPFFRASQGRAGKLLGGWGVTGLIIYQSGNPFTVGDSNGGSVFGLDQAGGTSTAQVVGGNYGEINGHGRTQDRLERYFGASAFTPAPCVDSQLRVVACGSPAVAGTTNGNSARNPLRGPFQQNWDLALFKHLWFTPRQKLEFRAEALNLWNHPVFASPGCGVGACSAPMVDIQSPDAGAITSTANRPRLLQFAAKYYW